MKLIILLFFKFLVIELVFIVQSITF